MARSLDSGTQLDIANGEEPEEHEQGQIACTEVGNLVCKKSFFYIGGQCEKQVAKDADGDCYEYCGVVKIGGLLIGVKQQATVY